MDKIIIDTGNQPTHAVLWLHGLGANGHDFESLATQIPKSVELPPTRFVFPHAPVMPITVNSGAKMRAWYDIASVDLSQQEDEQGMLKTLVDIDVLIEEIMDAGIVAKNIVLGGFSQGGAISLLSLTRQQKKLAGVVCLSGYMPLIQKFVDETLDFNEVNLQTPVFMAHGNLDNVVPIMAGDVAANLLRHKKFKLSYKRYQMTHNVSPDELKEVALFIKSCLI